MRGTFDPKVITGGGVRVPRWILTVAAAVVLITSVGAIMSRGVIALYPVEPAIKAIALMAEHRIRTIPIVTDTVAGTTVVGVVTRRDLAAALKP